jgi:hypothetical protein
LDFGFWILDFGFWIEIQNQSRRVGNAHKSIIGSIRLIFGGEKAAFNSAMLQGRGYANECFLKG